MGRKGQASLSANRIPVYWGSLPVAPTRKSSWQACPVSMHTHVQSVYTLPAQTQGHSPFRYEHAMCTHTPAGYHQHHGCNLPLHWVHTHPSQSHTSKAHGLCGDRLGPQITAWPPRPMERAGSRLHQPTRNSFRLYGIFMLLKAKIVSLRASKPG